MSSLFFRRVVLFSTIHGTIEGSHIYLSYLRHIILILRWPIKLYFGVSSFVYETTTF